MKKESVLRKYSEARKRILDIVELALADEIKWNIVRPQLLRVLGRGGIEDIIKVLCEANHVKKD